MRGGRMVWGLIVAVLAPLVVVVAVAPPASATPEAFTTFHALTPARLLDTRPEYPTIDSQFAGIGQLVPTPTISLSLQVAGRGGVPAFGAGAVAVNVTATNSAANGFLSLAPTFGPDPAHPRANISSSLNWAAGQTVANMSIVPLTSGRLPISIYARADVIIDVLGWFPPGPNATALPPARLLDTRPASPTVDGRFAGVGPIGGGHTLDVPVVGRGGVPSTGVGAVAVNLTVDQPSAPSFLTVYATGATRPDTSNLNFVAGQTVANMTIVPVGADGQISIANYDGDAPVIVDVLAWFPAGGRFSALTPARLLDTRPGYPTIDGGDAGGGPRGAHSRTDLAVLGRGGVPAVGVGAVAVNVTVTNPSAPSFITVFPSAATQPNSSNLNFVAGQTVANMTIVPVGPDGRISLANYDGATDLVVDVLGWFPTFAPAPPLTKLIGPVDGAVSSPYIGDATMSGDGRLVAFASSTPGLVPGDADDRVDVFVRNVVSGATDRISGPGISVGDAVLPQISRDGSTVTFVDATPGFPNQQLVVVRLADHSVQRFSVRPYGTPSISGDGRLVAFDDYDWYLPTSGPGYRENVWLLDTVTGAVTLVSARPDGTPGSDQSSGAVLAADGHSVVYNSLAANLTGVSGSVVLVRTTLADHATTAVGDATVPACTGVGHDFSMGPAAAVSADGNHIASSSMPFPATVCVRDLTAGTTRVIDSGSLPGIDPMTIHFVGKPAISDDGQTVAVTSSFDGSNACALFVDSLSIGVVERYDATDLSCNADTAMTPGGDHLLVTASVIGARQPFSLFVLDRSTG